MAKSLKIRVKARRLYEYESWSIDKIAVFLEGAVTPRTLDNWKEAEGWIKGKYAEDLREKERLTVLAEAEKAGIKVGKHLQELALIGYSDLANHMTVDETTGATRTRTFEEMNKVQPGASRVVKKIKETRVVRTVAAKGDAPAETITETTMEFQLHDKQPALNAITDILGLKRPEDESNQAADTIMSLIRRFRPK
ncbi:MAG: hypothetical protein ABI036_14195 [Fibrobacteria bacterium]